MVEVELVWLESRTRKGVDGLGWSWGRRERRRRVDEEEMGEEERTVGGKKEMCRVLPFAPLDTVDLLLDLERLEVVEFRLVRLARYHHPDQGRKRSDEIS